MLFGCPLPDELDGATSIGQHNVSKAFEAILSSAATDSQSFLEAIRDAHKQQGNDIKQVKYHLVGLHAMFAHVTVA